MKSVNTYSNGQQVYSDNVLIKFNGEMPVQQIEVSGKSESEMKKLKVNSEMVEKIAINSDAKVK